MLTMGGPRNGLLQSTVFCGFYSEAQGYFEISGLFILYEDAEEYQLVSIHFGRQPYFEI
jgi:hypothetical protein